VFSLYAGWGGLAYLQGLGFVLGVVVETAYAVQLCFRGKSLERKITSMFNLNNINQHYFCKYPTINVIMIIFSY
jgi:hypothetical protein